MTAIESVLLIVRVTSGLSAGVLAGSTAFSPLTAMTGAGAPDESSLDMVETGSDLRSRRRWRQMLRGI